MKELRAGSLPREIRERRVSPGLCLKKRAAAALLVPMHGRGGGR